MNKRRAQPYPKPSPGLVGSRRQTPKRTPGDDVRGAAVWSVERTLASLAPADLYLESALARFDERDQGLLRELVLGTLRWLRRLDDVIARASSRRFDQIEAGLQTPLRVAVYQLLFLDRVPAHAAVDEAVEMAHQVSHRGGASFVNGVLRRIAREPDLKAWPVVEDDLVQRLAIEQSHPNFLVARWIERFGRERAEALLRSNNRPKPMQLLAFRGRGGREQLAEQLIDEGMEVVPSFLSPLGLTVRRGNPLASAAFRCGSFYLQDEASQAAALLPPPRAGERIYDAAAAPGGKSFSLLAWEPSVELVAGDLALARAVTLRENLGRLRLGLPLFVADAVEPPFVRPFDRVVLDLPCTGTGTLRRHPEIKWRISEGEIGRLARQALRMLNAAAPLVAEGGLLVAITCSLEREENEDVVARFLAESSDFSPLPLAERLSPELARWITAPGAWRILTDGDHDGFSVHVLRKAPS